MAKKKKEKKPKKIIFSEEIDSAINGFAIGIVFIGTGLFLLLKPDYFSVPVVSYIIGAAIGLFGVAGTGIELSKSTKLKGIDTLSVGAFFFVIWLAQYIYIGKLWSNIAFFAILVIGGYGIILGTLQAVYSIIQYAKHDANEVEEEKHQDFSSAKLISQIILFSTQLCGLAVAILNLLKASKL